MQLMKEPTVPASRQEKPRALAASEHPENLPENDSAMIAIVKPHVTPSMGGQCTVPSEALIRTIVKQSKIRVQTRKREVLWLCQAAAW